MGIPKVLSDTNNLNLTDEELVESLSISAHRGYVPAYSFWGTFYGNLGKRKEEGHWYKKSAEGNDIIGMIYYGCFLSVVKHDKQNALKWLKKAMNDNRFDTFMKYQYFRKKDSRQGKIYSKSSII